MSLRLSTGLRNKMLGINTNMVINGAFDSATTDWIDVTATLSSEASGQDGNHLRVASSGANPGQAYQDITTKIGRLYKFTAYFQKGTADAGAIKIGEDGTPDALYDSGVLTDAEWALKTAYFVATATTTRITLESTDATDTEYSGFDTVILSEVLNGFQSIMDDCTIHIYSGTQPATADDVATGTKLVSITDNAGVNGLKWLDADAGGINKPSNQTWGGTASTTGTAGWFRCCEEDGDYAAASSTEARFDGSVAVSGAQLNISNTSIEATSAQTVASFSVNLPSS